MPGRVGIRGIESIPAKTKRGALHPAEHVRLIRVY